MDFIGFTDTFEENRYCLIEFSVERNTLRSDVVWWGDDTPPNISKVVILGVNTPITNVAIDEKVVPFEYDTKNKVKIMNNYFIILTFFYSSFQLKT